MYFDDSHTEFKVNEVTHCDLETKSILKPPKARAPLQEVDLGNQITVEFDVIRKRRVSFAGVNKIKEFNSEAKSFSICSTPAYEEKVSTSSDSSALSTSVSGNVNTLTKENDITLLDDTMDLTDLSIVQPSAMDITGIKPQKPSQGVPDIFAPRSQDLGLFSNQQGINRTVFAYETNNPNFKGGSGPNTLPTEQEKSNKSEETPIALDPRKMLLNELLEESAVDCSVDNFLKANTIFAQNHCNPGRNKCEIQKSPLEVSEMDFTQAVAGPAMRPQLHHVQPILEKKDFECGQTHAKVPSSRPSNLFGTLDVDIEQSSRAQDKAFGMEHPNILVKSKDRHTFPNLNKDESRSMKMDASQMEFTEALPSKNLAQSNPVASNYISERLLARTNTSPVEQRNPVPKMIQGHLNFNSNYNESRFGNSNMSQMEFTEALPSKNVMCHNMHTEQTKPFQKVMPSHMVPNFIDDESRMGNSNTSQMEFTEALPSKKIGHQNVLGPTSSIPQMVHPNNFPMPVPNQIIPNFNVDESRTGNGNASQMEFTEALPSKEIGHQNLLGSTSSSIPQTVHPNRFPMSVPNQIISNFNVDESRTGNGNVSQMEFTEALPPKNIVPKCNVDDTRSGNDNVSQMEFTEGLPSKNIGCQNLINHGSSRVSEMENPKSLPKSVPSHVLSNFNIDESRTKNTNTSQMEFTEALPSKNIALPNIDRSNKAKSDNLTQMELTMRSAPPALNNVAANNFIGDRLVDKINRSDLNPLKPSRNEIQHNMIPNLNTDGSKTENCIEATEREFREALSAELSHNNIILSDYIGDKLEVKLNITHFMPEKASLYDIQSDMFLNLNNKESISSKRNNAPPIESPEDHPSSPVVEVEEDNIVPSDDMMFIRPNNLEVHPSTCPDLIADKSISSEYDNASQMEFTEALPPKKLPPAGIVTSDSTENILLPQHRISQIVEPKINFNSEKPNYVDITEKIVETSQMELTEAVPMLKINKRKSTIAGVPSSYHRNTSQKHVVVDRENIPPSQDLNESNSMDVTELNFADSDNGIYNVDIESEVKVNINRNVLTVGSNPTDMRVINEVDASNMEFTEGLPVNVFRSTGKTEEKMFDNKEVKHSYVFPTTGVNNILGNSSCMEFTSALPSHKQPGKNAPSAVENVSPKINDGIPNEMNVSNTMDITEIDHRDIIRDLKEKENVEEYNIKKLISQPKFNLEQTVMKDVSQMDFTEALPMRNIQAPFNPAMPVSSDCENLSKPKVSQNNNLQTSNMEFTEVIPILKQATINSKGIGGDIPPNHEILQNKIVLSEQKLNDSYSMDVTDLENLPVQNIFKKSKDCLEIYDSKVNVKSTDCSEKSEIKETLGDEHIAHSQNIPSGSKNNYAKERITSVELQSDFSQLEFTEALPARNEINIVRTEKNIFSGENPVVNMKKSIMGSLQNYSLGTSSMEFTEFVRKPDVHHFLFASENRGKEKEDISPKNKENCDEMCSQNLTRTKNILNHEVVENSDENFAQEGSDKHVSDVLTKQNEIQVEKPPAEFLQAPEEDCKNFKSPPKLYENIFPIIKQCDNSSVDATQMDFTGAVQPHVQLKDNIKLGIDYEVIEKRSDKSVDSESDVNKIPDASQMEFTEALVMPKCQSNLYSIETSKAATSGLKEVVQPNVENESEFLPFAPSGEQKNIFMNENQSKMKNPIIEEVADIDCILKPENDVKDYSRSISSEANVIVNACSEIFQNTNKISEKSSMVLSDKDRSQELVSSLQLKNESASSNRNLGVFSPMHVDEPSLLTIDKKESKVDSLRKLFENESKSDNSAADFLTPKGKRFSSMRSTEGNGCESSSNSKSISTVVKTVTVDSDTSQKKNLVHFNTPPVRIIKRRKTMGFPNPEESVQLLQSNTSDLASPFHDSTAPFLQNSSQRRGIFEEEKKSDYDPDKGKEEWDRLVKNDAFMKERSFHFVNPCKWKYEFRWPMVLILEIPDIVVSENSRKKNISLVSNISESDHISVFIHNRMKKNMSVILSEKWLNSHCKTIKDLLFTIKFIEEEYNKLEPLISSMKYFYQEYPFDFVSDRIMFYIVNLRKPICFEVKIDVSYGQVKGKNIDVINHVGEIRKTEIQQLFDQLQPNTERFYLFWQKLREIHE